MNKIAAYELLLENHPLWIKEAELPVTKITPVPTKSIPTMGRAALAGGALGGGALYLGYKALTRKKK